MNRYDETVEEAHESTRVGWTLLRALLAHWWLLGTCAIVGLLSGAIAGWLQPRTYQASALLAPVAPESTTLGLGAVLPDLRSLAGVLGQGAGSDHLNRGVATLRSRRFCELFLTREGVRERLTEDLARRWSIMRLLGRTPEPPTTEDLCLYFSKDVRQIGVDARTNFITISVRHRDRKLAAEWANALVESANKELQRQAIEEAARNVQFLREELQRTEAVEVRAAINRAMESKIQMKALAATRPEYAFAVIDPAAVPDADNYVSPQRLLMALAGAFLGLLIGCAFVLLRGSGPVRPAR
jgi:uncharacterized protein involved in exopolysaccharide biosynthesis